MAPPADPTGLVLEQTSSDRTDYRFPLAIYQGATAANLEVTVRFKTLAGEVDRAGGLAVRLADADNYYVVRANALEDNINLYRVVKGVRSQIHGVVAKVSSGIWHMLGLRVDDTASYCAPFYVTKTAGFSDRGFVLPGSDD